MAFLLKRVCSSGNFSIPLVVRSEYLNDCLRQLEQWNAQPPSVMTYSDCASMRTKFPNNFNQAISSYSHEKDTLCCPTFI